jgi:multicomponent Na+:H+ antiporter subunit A
MIYLDILMCVLLVVAAAVAMGVRNLVSAAIMVGVVSLHVSYIFLRMNAPDVAMTEAAIGAGLTTVIFLVAIRRTEEEES